MVVMADRETPQVHKRPEGQCIQISRLGQAKAVLAEHYLLSNGSNACLEDRGLPDAHSIGKPTLSEETPALAKEGAAQSGKKMFQNGNSGCLEGLSEG